MAAAMMAAPVMSSAGSSVCQERTSSTYLLQASDVGLHDMPDVPSLSLGTGLVTPLELTTAFATFPNGERVPILRVLADDPEHDLVLLQLEQRQSQAVLSLEDDAHDPEGLLDGRCRASGR